MNLTIHLNNTFSGTNNYSTSTAGYQELITIDFRLFYNYGFEFILYGYFMPVWTSLCIAMYVVMVTVFLRYGMTTKTHICLIAIAVCDSLSPIAPASTWMYFFAIQKNYYYLPFEWCRYYHLTTEVIPQLFTYTSYFITIMMTVHRYIMVAHPFKAEKLCSKTVIYVMIFGLFLSSCLIRIVHFFHFKYVSTTVPEQNDTNQTMQACSYARADWLPIPLYHYIGILLTIQTMVVGVVPCTVLVVSELLMVKSLSYRAAMRKIMTGKSSERSKTAKSEKRLTVTTIIITAITLSYMIPVVILQIIDVSITMFNARLPNYNDLRTAVVILNVFYWLCIPSNFLVTCCLSHEFRNGIKRLFVAAESVHTSVSSSVTVAKTNITSVS